MQEPASRQPFLYHQPKQPLFPSFWDLGDSGGGGGWVHQPHTAQQRRSRGQLASRATEHNTNNISLVAFPAASTISRANSRKRESTFRGSDVALSGTSGPRLSTQSRAAFRLRLRRAAPVLSLMITRPPRAIDTSPTTCMAIFYPVKREPLLPCFDELKLSATLTIGMSRLRLLELW
ncbi:hypothetical protein B0T24DRAFT_114051 [Lasiosphaeria ovina]|uniref:Uncharacterized protein n=1 Tax=Lasiosphaeria ovina TaxID=92902 RepID=A0AAE0JST4_9PEZI|nr:hypothetical protein B0T24DRAFT_114051 [Lasiosphaeria ovina]